MLMDALTCVVIPSLWQSSDWPSLHFPLFFNPLIFHVTRCISSTSPLHLLTGPQVLVAHGAREMMFQSCMTLVSTGASYHSPVIF
jgi:hypothetical protein